MSKRIGTLLGAALAAGSLAALPGGERLASAAPPPAVGRQAVSPRLAPARQMPHAVGRQALSPRLASARPMPPATGRQALSPPLAPARPMPSARPMLPATGASAAPATDADTALTVSTTQDSSGVVSATSLMCQPPSGHPHANEVCAQLARGRRSHREHPIHRRRVPADL